MRHFVCEIVYKAPLEKIQETTDEHRAFLRQGYEKGLILISGPQVPRLGGIVIARGESMESMDEFFKNDPYQKKGLAEYKFIEFSPKNFQDFLKEWAEA
ncbi:MAG: YciI family protein [Syntrophothermus sp.]